MTGARGLIAVDKKGGTVLFLNPRTFETEIVLGGFKKTVHELLVVPEAARAYVPIFGDGIHGRNPNPQNVLCVFDLEKRELLTMIDLWPCSAPHTLRLGPDGLIYVTCENSANIAIVDPATNRMVETIETGSSNCHRLTIAPDGQRLYTENEEDATISVIDVPGRRLLGKIETPSPLGGIAISADSRTVVAVDDTEPALLLIDAERERLRGELRLRGVPQPAQIARYAPDWSLLAVTSMNSGTVTLIDPSFEDQTTVAVGSQPMDMAFYNERLFVACQGDGSIHVIDVPGGRQVESFAAGVGCECLGFF